MAWLGDHIYGRGVHMFLDTVLVLLFVDIAVCHQTLAQLVPSAGAASKTLLQLREKVVAVFCDCLATVLCELGGSLEVKGNRAERACLGPVKTDTPMQAGCPGASVWLFRMTQSITSGISTQWLLHLIPLVISEEQSTPQCLPRLIPLLLTCCTRAAKLLAYDVL